MAEPTPDKPPPKMTGQAIRLLIQPWLQDLYAYDRDVQKIEATRFKNTNITENGIHRRMISTEERDSDLTYGLNKLVSAQPFDSKFVRALFSNIHVVFVGDSLIRAMYKDLLVLLQNGGLTPDDLIKQKIMQSWFGDKVLDTEDPEDKTEYVEFREYLKDEYWIQYCFTTRIYNEKVDQLLSHFEVHKPDVVVIHSNIWDCTRYSTDDRISLTQYALRLSYMCQRLKEILDPTALVIFVLLPPASYEQSTKRAIKKGFFSVFSEERMRDLNKVVGMVSSAANYFCAQVASSYGFDVLDLNYHFQQENFAALRGHDGLHYVSFGVRIINQTLIGHIIKAWEVELPQEVAEKFEKLQAEFFENHHNCQDMEEKENQLADMAIFKEIPECYMNFFSMNMVLYEEVMKENRDLGRDLTKNRHVLIKEMKTFVTDPFLKKYTISLFEETPETSNNPVQNLDIDPQFDEQMPITSQQVFENQRTQLIEPDDMSISSGRSKNSKVSNAENIEERREILKDVQNADRLIEKRWSDWFDEIAKKLNERRENQASTESLLTPISDDEDKKEVIEPISDDEIESDHEMLPEQTSNR